MSSWPYSHSCTIRRLTFKNNEEGGMSVTIVSGVGQGKQVSVYKSYMIKGTP